MPFQHYLIPNWPVPPYIKAFTTLRMDGHSQAPYDAFNLGLFTADNTASILKNRQQLKTELGLIKDPAWIKQVHGTRILQADTIVDMPQADALWTTTPNVPCVVLTADCLPLLICGTPKVSNQSDSHANTETSKANCIVAAVHAGWRGLTNGIIEATLDQLILIQGTIKTDWRVWLGPAIGPTAFEVGAEVYERSLQNDAQAALAFKSLGNDQWLANIYLLAKQRLSRYGITQIDGGQYCTWSDPSRFYSYRRDAEKSGRMASIIWIRGEDEIICSLSIKNGEL